MLHGTRRFDLDDAENLRVDRSNVRMRAFAEAGATRREGEPAGAVGRVTDEGDRFTDLVRRVHSRDHHAVRPEVQDAADTETLGGLRTDESGRARRPDRVEVPDEVCFCRESVLEV